MAYCRHGTRAYIALGTCAKKVLFRLLVGQGGPTADSIRREARNDLAKIQDISIWPSLVAWPAGTVLGLSVAFF